MAGFWKRISGGYARDRKWVETPRVLPERYRDYPPGSDKFIVTQAFAGTPRNLHQYMAAFQEDDGKWTTAVITTDVKTNRSSLPYETTHDTPLDVVKRLADWENEIRQIGNNDDGEKFYVPVKDSGETYKIFAQRYGIHFDSENTPYMPTTKDAGKRKVLLTGQALTQVFDASKTDTRLYRDWQGLSEVFKADDLSDQEMLAQPHHETLMQHAQNLVDVISDSGLASSVVGAYRAAVQQFCSEYDNEWSINEVISDKPYRDLVMKAMQSSTLYYILDKGAAEYEAAVKEGFKPESSHLRETKTIGKIAREFAKDCCGFSDAQAEAVCSVMQKGRYPGEKFPIETFVDRMSASLEGFCADAAETVAKKPKRRQLKK